MKHILTISLYLFALTVLASNADCKVKQEPINKRYEGDCKKGYAHGIGKAWGEEDQYEGAFKKGLPHGEGKYTWGNGSHYSGAFVKGKMDGRGVLVLKDTSGKDTVKKGYFKDNEYLGEYKDPYKVISNQGIRKVDFVNRGIKGLKEVRLVVYSNGSIITPSLTIRDINNTRVEQNNGTVMSNVIFPLKRVEVSFTVNTISYHLIFEIYQQGNWEVNISL